MNLVSIDLGSTNVKVMAYDANFHRLWSGSREVQYQRDGKFVEFDTDASGLFVGLKTRHDAYDLAGAVMEGVALLLDRTLESLHPRPTSIISTGGGAKSPLWLQLKADITGIEVRVPADKEAALLGAAIMGAVNAGLYSDYEAAVQAGVRMENSYTPRTYPAEKKQAYDILYKAMLRAKF